MFARPGRCSTSFVNGPWPPTASNNVTPRSEGRTNHRDALLLIDETTIVEAVGAALIPVRSGSRVGGAQSVHRGPVRIDHAADWARSPGLYFITDESVTRPTISWPETRGYAAHHERD